MSQPKDPEGDAMEADYLLSLKTTTKVRQDPQAMAYITERINVLTARQQEA